MFGPSFGMSIDSTSKPSIDVLHMFITWMCCRCCLQFRSVSYLFTPSIIPYDSAYDYAFQYRTRGPEGLMVSELCCFFVTTSIFVISMNWGAICSRKHPTPIFLHGNIVIFSDTMAMMLSGVLRRTNALLYAWSLGLQMAFLRPPRIAL